MNRERSEQEYLLDILNGKDSFDIGVVSDAFAYLLHDRLNGEYFNKFGDIWPYSFGNCDEGPVWDQVYLSKWNHELRDGKLCDDLAECVLDLRLVKKPELMVVGFSIDEVYPDLRVQCFY